MTVAVYCQHVLGMGHLVRTLEIVAALDGHARTLFLGGPEAPVPVPPDVSVIRLPALAMDAAFAGLTLSGSELEAVKAERSRLLFDGFDRLRPSVFLVELYPFGRKAFEFELVPLLSAVRRGRFGPCTVVCAVRDILVEKKDRDAYEARVLDRLGKYFDAVLVQADPALVPLEATFARTADIPVPVRYTGYVATRPGPGRSREAVRRALGVDRDKELVVVSAGGGRVGFELPLAVLAACRAEPRLARAAVRVFGGPYAPDAAYGAMEAAAAALPDARVRRFAPDFPDILAAADLSVSLAGYNTVMALLAAGPRALVLPFDQNREQRLRAGLLAQQGLLGLLDPADLDPARLAARLTQALTAPPGPRPAVDLDGARRTASVLEEWLVGGMDGKRPPAAGGNHSPRTP